ncbi:MAG: hypothetical protein QOD29_4403 [Alphaproteobacteria bacterium]|nr:hypothetical protein [Alphaproteobacteria bacterium]
MSVGTIDCVLKLIFKPRTDAVARIQVDIT